MGNVYSMALFLNLSTHHSTIPVFHYSPPSGGRQPAPKVR